MKTKPARKSSQKKKVDKEPATIQAETVPPGLEIFAELKGKSHIEQVVAISPLFNDPVKIDDLDKLSELAGAFSGLELDLGIKVPEWAVMASRKFFEVTLGLDFLKNLENCQPEEMGKFLELCGMLKSSNPPSQLDNAIQALAKLIKTEAVELPPDKNLKFATGRLSAEKLREKARNLSQRSKVYAIIASKWRLIEKLKSAAELHNWLLTHGIIVPSTEAAETRKVCRIIGLKLREKAGRPPENK